MNHGPIVNGWPEYFAGTFTTDKYHTQENNVPYEATCPCGYPKAKWESRLMSHYVRGMAVASGVTVIVSCRGCDRR